MLKLTYLRVLAAALVAVVFLFGLYTLDRQLLNQHAYHTHSEVRRALDDAKVRLDREISGVLHAVQAFGLGLSATVDPTVPVIERLGALSTRYNPSLVQVGYHPLFSGEASYYPPASQLTPLPMPQVRLLGAQEQTVMFAADGGVLQILHSVVANKGSSPTVVSGRVDIATLLEQSVALDAYPHVQFHIDYRAVGAVRRVSIWGTSPSVEIQASQSILPIEVGELRLSAWYLGEERSLPATVWLLRLILLLFAIACALLAKRYLVKLKAVQKLVRRLRNIFAYSPIPTVGKLASGSSTFYVNSAFEDCYGYNAKELQELEQEKGVRGVLERLFPEPVQYRNTLRAWARQIRHRTEGLHASMDVVVCCKSGEQKKALLSVVFLDHPNIDEWMAVLVDVQEQYQADKKNQLYSQVFNAVQEAIVVTDRDEKVVDINPAYSAITGFEKEEVVGSAVPRIYTDQQGEAFFHAVGTALKNTGQWRGEYWSRRKSDEFYQRDMSLSAVYDDDGKLTHYVSVFTDVTEKKRQQKELELMKHFDLLTQLPNRALFTDRFEQAAARCRRNGTLIAVCIFDLDEFKQINHQYGELVGDQLLIAVSNRIRMSVREEDTLSRFGGDEFTLLLGDIDTTDSCIQTLERIQENLRYPYDLNGQQIKTSASIGVTLYPQDDDDLDMLLRHADQAMYQAKLTGRDTYCLFNRENDQRLIAQHDRLRTIEEALADEQFVLYYQPKVNLSTGDVFGVEALIRWRHPERGVLPPGAFLPHVDGHAVELDMGHWVILAALKQMDEWYQQELELQVSINISSFHMQSGLFYTQLQEALDRYSHINPAKLQIEVLESSTLADISSIRDMVAACHDELGVSIALDDFGTGYSSLTHIKELNADTVKIDQTFVRDLLEDPNDYAIADGVIRLADAFGRQVVAEGVEEVEHGLMLMAMGCAFAQGYCIAKPMPAEDVGTWIENYEHNAKWREFPFGQLTPAESQLTIFKTSFNYWAEKIASTLEEAMQQDDSQYCAIRSGNHCHCGVWLEREKRNHLFDQQWVVQLEKSHRKVHALADEIETLGEGAQQVLQAIKFSEFESARDKVSALIERPVFAVASSAGHATARA